MIADCVGGRVAVSVGVALGVAVSVPVGVEMGVVVGMPANQKARPVLYACSAGAGRVILTAVRGRVLSLQAWPRG